jgi:multidrug efflux pump
MPGTRLSASASHLVANQSEVVEEAVGEFIKTLIEAIVIVLAVSFLSLGWRPGIVVAIAIPLVLAITFVVMKLAGVSLQRISLGALIIGLGLLVDDAMIAVEMMIKKLEEGADKVTAATFAYTSTAFPMLTGTLVTLAGFVPVGFAASSAGIRRSSAVFRYLPSRQPPQFFRSWSWAGLSPDS